MKTLNSNGLWLNIESPTFGMCLSVCYLLTAMYSWCPCVSTTRSGVCLLSSYCHVFLVSLCTTRSGVCLLHSYYHVFLVCVVVTTGLGKYVIESSHSNILTY